MEKDDRIGLIIFGSMILLALGILSFHYYDEEIRPELQEKEAKKKIEAYLKQANEALNQGNYSDAYAIADIMISKGYRYDNAGYDLNERILTNEIATIIEENEDNSAPKLLFAIKERAKYNTDTYHGKREEEEMFKYTIELVTTMGYKQTASLLQNALDKYTNDKN